MRRRAAIIALLLWGLGIEFAPAVHVAFHELLEHHTHAGEPADDDSPEHGGDSLAHKDIAWLQAPPPPPVAPVRRVEETPSRHIARATPRSRQLDSLRIRGPPGNVHSPTE